MNRRKYTIELSVKQIVTSRKLSKNSWLESFIMIIFVSLDPFQRQAETMLSSERLAMAVQLAKLDIRKLKTMLNKGK